MDEPLNNSRDFVGSKGSRPGSLSLRGKRYQDVWAALLFIAHLIAVIVIAGVLYMGSDDFNNDENPQTGTKFADKAVGLCAGTLPTAILLSLAWMLVMRNHPKGLIYLTLALGVILNLLCSIVLLALGQLAGLVFLFVALMSLAYAYLVRHRIEFAAVMLRKSVSVIQQYPSLIPIVIAAQVVMAGFFVFWAMAAVGVHKKESGGLWLVLVLSLYWTIEVIRNVCHVAVSGTTATVYFQGSHVVDDAVSRSLKRALTTSFGSICFGSLCIAIIRTLRAIVRSLKEQARSGRSKNVAALVFLCCLDCMLSGLEYAVQFFNKYALVHVAVYGKGFIASAKDTWHIFKTSGIDVLINDDLIEGVMVFGAFVTGTINALVWMGIAKASLDSNGSDWVLVTVIAFIVGFGLALTIFTPVDSAVATLYVCFAEQPEILAHTDPAFHTALTQALAARQMRVPGSAEPPPSQYRTYQGI